MKFYIPLKPTFLSAAHALLLYRLSSDADSARFPQGIRHYAAQGASGGSSNTFLYSGLAAAAAAIGGGSYYFLRQPVQPVRKVAPPSAPSSSSPVAFKDRPPPLASDSKPSNSTFTGGEQGWISLKLESVEKLNRNTNKFRFSLPNPDDVSGLQIACRYLWPMAPVRGSLKVLLQLHF